MHSILHHQRLTEHRIDRSPADMGTLFPGDTRSVHSVDPQQFSGEGFCQVSTIRYILSSHAGTHADQPPHFHPKPEFQEFPDICYQGSAIVLDVSKRLREEIKITTAMIEDALGALTLHRFPPRVLVRTLDTEDYPREPREIFPYLSEGAAETLVRVAASPLNATSFPRATLIGIDTPSVDHPNEKKLLEHVHGILYRARIAIVENLQLRQKMNGDQGELLTLFDPLRAAPDAKGIAAMFFFPTALATTAHDPTFRLMEAAFDCSSDL